MNENYYKSTDEEFTEVVKKSFSIADVLRELGMSAYGANYKTFAKRAQRLNLDLTHFGTKTGTEENKHKKKNKILKTEDMFVENSTDINGSVIRRRLIKENIIPYECKECKITKWQGESISLAVDHINGNAYDNRIENLRFLCPNCHSQTNNFGSRNPKGNGRTALQRGLREKEKVVYYCELCGEERLSKQTKYCGNCYMTRRDEIKKTE